MLPRRESNTKHDHWQHSGRCFWYSTRILHMGAIYKLLESGPNNKILSDDTVQFWHNSNVFAFSFEFWTPPWIPNGNEWAWIWQSLGACWKVQLASFKNGTSLCKKFILHNSHIFRMNITFGWNTFSLRLVLSSYTTVTWIGITSLEGILSFQ